jgi:predicted NUDIX family NTP pyrophosphohydrolase
MMIKKFNQFINENEQQVKTSAGLAIIWENMVLLAHTTGRNFKTGYGIPKGGIKMGETQIEAAIREVSEEVGINVNKNMIEPKGYQFGVNARKWGFKKIVHYHIVKINQLQEINLNEPKLPKQMLQLEEINDARFMDLKEARKVTMKSQQPLLDNLEKLGLLK